MDECVELSAVLLAAQVEPGRLGQLGRVTNVPADVVSVGNGGGVAQVDLDLLAVGIDPAVRCPTG